MITHPHAGEQARRIAAAGTVLLTEVGSGVHGTALEGQDDRDELGLCLEPEEFVTGSARVETPGGRLIAFEQYELHTAWHRPRGQRERSGPGDLDVVVYSARKWVRLAAAGNPTALLPLWVPDSGVVQLTAAGRELRANADRFASRTTGRRFLGYLRSQAIAALAPSGRRRTNSQGYVAKPATHALRLGIQGLELLRTGRVSLPVAEPDLSALRRVRSGEAPAREVRGWLDDLELALDTESRTADLPEGPDRRWIDAWLHRSYEEFWTTSSA